jgi:hypothetical protein
MSGVARAVTFLCASAARAKRLPPRPKNDGSTPLDLPGHPAFRRREAQRNREIPPHIRGGSTLDEGSTSLLPLTTIEPAPEIEPMHPPSSARILGGLVAGFLAFSSAAAPLQAAGGRMTAEQLARHIDRLIQQKIKAEKATLSPRATDGEFLRRVYLDLTGRIPPAARTVEFLDSKSSDKRAKLIDELLGSPEFGRRLADVWQALLLPRSAGNRRVIQYYPNVEKWLQEQFNRNAGWDTIATQLVTAVGPVNKPGPAPYYLANDSADKVTDNVSKVLLGLQLQCAQCHNHPFAEWKQNDYWHMAAFFTRVGPNGNVKKGAKKGAAITIGEGMGKRKKTSTGKVLPPRVLGGEPIAVKPNQSVRPVLAKWLTSPKNPYFARAMVNRTWGQLFGRGLINPVDDMRESNECSHPELLADLAGQFADHEFDVKYLFRAICNSDAYQRSSRPAGKGAAAPPELFASRAVKPLSPGQLFDSLTLLMGSESARDKGVKGKAKQGGKSPRNSFIAFFGVAEGADPTEYQAGIPQVLRLMNSPQFNRAALLRTIMTSSRSRAEITEKLYLTVLSRRPSSEETSRIERFLDKQADDRQAFADVLWALMNSSEFALNR